MRWYLRPDERLPQPSSVSHADDRLPVVAGTVLWALLAVVGWVAYDDLDADGHTWWLWTAVAGAALGVLGSYVMQRRHNRGR